ncbi:Serine protease 23 [Larimichthys crocea]|uniref:Serine protease 23 n=1 Tax=Larimichthys crocea TaxID=215358 RepID=A0A6G0J1Q2_LARCR|nr:Serine protease 23 [Larimichthys crocea]
MIQLLTSWDSPQCSSTSSPAQAKPCAPGLRSPGLLPSYSSSSFPRFSPPPHAPSGSYNVSLWSSHSRRRLDQPLISCLQARLDVSSPCDPECHKRAPRPSYWDLRRLLAYETLHSNGQLTETAIGIYGYSPSSNTSPAYSAGSSGKAERSHVRRKRQIFGHDGRFSIAGQDFLLKFPFSVSVKLSTGCSGTLVGDRHVLTAAHCVHDGKNYVKGAQKLRVGFLKPKQRDTQQSSFYLRSNFTNHAEGGASPYAPPTNDKMKFQWIRAKRTHVPKGWIKGNANDIGMDYDYALLELKKPHKRPPHEIRSQPPGAEAAWSKSSLLRI